MIERACNYANDQARLLALLLAYRAAGDVRRYPTIWRVWLLLTSRVGEPAKDTLVWELASGEIIGLAMLWRRDPCSQYLVLDSFAHPAHVSADLLSAMLQWGDQRALEIVAQENTPITLYANGFSYYPFAAPLLAQYDFTPLPSDPTYRNVYLARLLQADTPAPVLPDGFTIRALTNVHDLAAYQSLYGFAKVNPMHQQELLASDEYRHFVVADAQGEFVAYCECSICRAEWQVTAQRIGWIDYVGTKSELQGQGLGRAILLAGLAQLQKWGAQVAMLVTISTNTPALSLYNRAGFACVDVPEYRAYEKQIPITWYY